MTIARSRAALAGLVAAGVLFSSTAALANVAGTVDVAAGDTLRVRTQPNTTSTIVTNLADGAPISIICQTTGPTVTGVVRTTNLWDKLSNGYVSHAFVRTSATSIPTCGTTTATSPQGKVSVAAGDTLKVRSGPGTSYAQVTSLANGATITLQCATSGTSVNGNTTWYKISSGYVSAAYVTRTNTVTVPACTTTTPPPPPTSASRTEIIQRAQYWFDASNGRVSGVAAFGRNPNASAKEGPTGSALYRRDCSGLIAMAWKLGSGNQPSSSGFKTSSYTKSINVTDLQAGDILTADGHVTMFHQWVNKSTWTYLAYDFGGGTGGAGPVEHKQYQLNSVSGSMAKRTNDSRQYYARRSLKL